MSSWAAMYVVYNEEEYIEYSISSVLDHVDQVLVLRGLRPWHGPELDLDRTSDIVRSIDSPKVTLVEGAWRSEAEQRNEALDRAVALGCEFGLIIDADEVYSSEVLHALISTAEANPQVDVWRTTMWTYWKSPLWRIMPPEPHKPAVAMRFRPDVRFLSIREPAARVVAEMVGTEPLLHHFSYAKPSSRILDKIRSFEHADEILDGWWEDKWLAWDSDRALEDLHPAVPPCYKRAMYIEPEELPTAMRHHPYVTCGVNGLSVQEPLGETG